MSLSRTAAAVVFVASLVAAPISAQETTEQNDSWLPSLVTATPAEGFDLAVTIARKAVTTTQTDKDVLHSLRPNYSHDPESLIQVSGVIAAYFQTVAEANDYWRE